MEYEKPIICNDQAKKAQLTLTTFYLKFCALDNIYFCFIYTVQTVTFQSKIMRACSLPGT